MHKILFVLFFFLIGLAANATHIVGGEFTYEFIGNNQYRITFDLYRDCEKGSKEAIADDVNASFGIYNNDNDQWLDRFPLISTDATILPPDFNNSCITNAPNVCLNRLRFRFTRTIPINNSGYLIVYQRCCRNTAQNINGTNGNQVGATYFTTINPQFGFNNSAVPKSFPPQIICINNPLIYDASEIDADGDSLSYALCNAKDYDDIQNPAPTALQINKPPYQDIPYQLGYSGGNPITSSPAISIDPKTGIMTGTPTQIGRFVVTLCCTEWRNGIAVCVNRRDFQFEITNCSKTVLANTPVFSDEPNTYIVNCQDYSVKFKNTSSGGFSYNWDFGVTNSAADVSTTFEPVFIYPDTGTYVITLTVNKGSTCPDSIKRIVKIYPKINADFLFSGKLCPGEAIMFTNTSNSLFYPITSYVWNFDDGTTSNIENPIKTFAGRNVPYNVALFTKSNIGCKDTAYRSVNVPAINFTAGNDTTVLKNVPVQLTAAVASSFTWTPSTFLNNSFIGNPIGFYPDTGTYTYFVHGITQQGCDAYDTINIFVTGDFSLIVPSAFSPNSDKLNDVLEVLQAGYGQLNYFRIFDRWGKALFYTTNFTKNWDGTFNGQDCESGVYFWMASATNILGQTKTVKGDVFLAR
jgi:gliding motility-associated-like protein